MSDTILIAVPTEGAGGLDAPRSAHFGHAANFTVVEVGSGEIASARVLANDHDTGGCLAPVDALASAGVSAIVVAGMGGRPRAAFAAAGVDVLLDQQSPTPRLAVERLLAGESAQMGEHDSCSCH